MKALFVSRHKPQPRQIQILKELGITEVIEYAEQVKDVRELVAIAKEKDAKVIIPVLPIPMLMQLLPIAQREGIEVWIWTMTRKTVSLEEAEKLKKQGITVDIDLTSGRAVAFIPVKLSRLVEIKVVTEDLWTSQ